MSDQDKIDIIMDNFNFIAVEKTMKALKWEWAGAKNKIPTLQEIKIQARKMLKDAVKNNCYSTAGFETHKDIDGNISIQFVVERYDSFYHNI